MSATKKLLDGAEVAEVLSGTFYAGAAARAPKLRAVEDTKPSHYKVICISMYNGDLERLDGMVEELKKRGFTKANRSALIRFALEQADLDKVQKGM